MKKSKHKVDAPDPARSLDECRQWLEEQMSKIVTSEECMRCGKPIAEMPEAEAFCCACRYGSRAWRDKPVREPDLVDGLGDWGNVTGGEDV